MVVKPGQPLTISCKVSYSVSSYYTSWIRQPAGKALEWIGYIDTSGGTAYKDSLKNKFTISRDTSSNTVSLHGSSLQTGDTAVYYCAPYTQCSKATAGLYKNPPCLISLLNTHCDLQRVTVQQSNARAEQKPFLMSVVVEHKHWRAQRSLLPIQIKLNLIELNLNITRTWITICKWISGLVLVFV